MTKEGVEIYSAAQVREVKRTEDAVTLYVSPWKVTDRGQTLKGPLLTVQISSPMLDILRVQTWHFMGSEQKGPEFSLQDEHCHLHVEENDAQISITSGKLSAAIRKNNFSLSYAYDGRVLTTGGTRQLSYLTGTAGRVYARTAEP